MQSYCLYCGENLVGGDIYKILKQENPEMPELELRALAASHGWTKENGKRFSRLVIVENRVECPKCHRVAPWK